MGTHDYVGNKQILSKTLKNIYKGSPAWGGGLHGWQSIRTAMKR